MVSEFVWNLFTTCCRLNQTSQFRKWQIKMFQTSQFLFAPSPWLLHDAETIGGSRTQPEKTLYYFSKGHRLLYQRQFNLNGCPPYFTKYNSHQSKGTPSSIGLCSTVKNTPTNHQVSIRLPIVCKLRRSVLTVSNAYVRGYHW